MPATLLLALALLATPGDPPRLHWQLDGHDTPPGLGTVLAPSPDRDGDGVADLLVGLPGLATGPAAGPGEVRVLSGADGHVLLTIPGRVAGEAFGAAVASLPDMDADGHPDLLIGAPRNDRDAVNAGAARVHSGRNGHLIFRVPGRGAEAVPMSVYGDEPFGLLGASVAAGGDVDGDGSPDLLVSGPCDPHAGSEAGVVLVISGDKGTVLARHWGADPGERFGHVIASLPDRDGDGAADLLVSAPSAERKGVPRGRLVVLSARSGRQLLEILGEPGDRLGESLVVLPDLDDDGLPEIAAGAPGASAKATAGGAVRLYSGRTGKLLRSLEGSAAHERLGAVIALAGDSDGDGLPELALGSTRAAAGGLGVGQVRLHALADGALLRRVDGWLPTQRLGLSLAPLGDVDGDGLADLAVGWLHGARPGPLPGALGLLAGAPPSATSDKADTRKRRR